MRKFFLGIALFFALLSVVFTFLPLGTLAFIPTGIGLIFGFLALKQSEVTEKKWAKIALIISFLSLVFVVGKEIFIDDTVETDQQFETQKLESKDEAQKELEELE